MENKYENKNRSCSLKVKDGERFLYGTAAMLKQIHNWGGWDYCKSLGLISCKIEDMNW